ncbi:MAG TPA: hypothetical protein VJO33_19025 [Gemmatimonadaceae bacterium]|nr:hypothetical protein [Gemmatimonadaceae bacterium]
MTSATQESVSLTRSVNELWLDVLQQISTRTAHELKGALNGVAVNLEVVRSRSARADAAAASVAPFAASASSQLDAVVEMSQALLSLSRAARDPLDIGETVASFAAILGPSARAHGGSLRVEPHGRDFAAGPVRVRGNVARLVIGATLLAALARKGDARCTLESGDDIVVSVECAGAEGPPDLSAEVMTAAATAGIRVNADRGSRSISLAFPRAGSARKRTPERA